MDFYPDGGSVQQGCMFGIDALPGGFIAFSWPYLVMFMILGACSHVRSLLYYLHSIREEDLFTSSSCSSVETCNQEMVEDDTVIAYMGERAVQDYQG